MAKQMILKIEEFPTFKVSWPWPWGWSHDIPSCITQRPLSTHQNSSRSEELFYGQTYGRMDVN